MLMALLLPDPCDPACPKDFIFAARDILLKLHGRPRRWDSKLNTPEGLRKILLEFIGDLSNWDNAANMDYLSTARTLVKAAHSDETPLVVDTFAGGGSIPLEALRLGCEAFASDLNPVACLILKVMLEDIPRHGPGLAEDLRKVGDEIKTNAEKKLAEFYPKDLDGAMPIAYLWARTVNCDAPNCGAEIPLMRSFWLCKKASRKRAIRHKVYRPPSGPPYIEFEIFEPKADEEVHGGTVTRAKAKCLCCGTVLPPERVRALLSEQRGGADVIFDKDGARAGGARLLAIVTIKQNEHERQYRLPILEDYLAVWKAMRMLEKEAIEKLLNGLNLLPDEPLPPKNTNSFRIPNYGMKQWSDISTARQKLALATLAREVRQLRGKGVSDLRDAIALTVSRCTDFNASLNLWATEGEFVAHVFGRQALSMVWDFCEVMPFSTESGGYDGAVDWVARVVLALGAIEKNPGQVQQADACESPLPDEAVSVWFTDPPYYDAVGYAELSDFFYVWLKRILPEHQLLKDPYDPKNTLVHKQRECVQDEKYLSATGKPKDRLFFEETMANAFAKSRRIIKNDGIGSVVFAHKTTEGWEALLSGMIKGGWTITGSWPIATERPGRLRSQDSAALATSVHLVCRPRPENALVGDWSEILSELPKRVGDWMERLQNEGIRGADLVFACIGPALEIFSRYRKVETADGREVKLAQFLEKVWEVVGRTALEQVLGSAEAKARNGAAGAVEEDARLTALFLWTLQSTNGRNGSDGESDEEASDESGGDEDEEETAPRGKTKGFSLVFDVVRRFAQPLGIELPKWEGRVIETKKGVVRLMAVSERAKQLFGEDGADAVADWIEHDPQKNLQQVLFPEFEEEQAPKIRGSGRARRKMTLDPSAVEGGSMREATTLDRVHAAMLLQAGGQANGLRALTKAEQERGPVFLRLANALSALYPKNSEEKRLLDAMLLAVPR